MKKFFIKTFGCQMNVYDSERIAIMLSKSGLSYTDCASKADIIIINSCSVREKPLQKLFSCAGRYLPLKKEKGVKIFIVGCVAQQLGKEIIEIAPYIDAVLGPGAEALIPEIVMKGKYPVVSTEKELLEAEEIFPDDSKGVFFEKESSSITVMHGCDNFCSYCIVPFVRGREISRKMASILNEVDILLDKGIVEITLLGQNVNSYRDSATGADFTDLLYEVAKKERLLRLRFTTSHPKDFNEKLALSFAEIPKLMPSLHLPAQSGSDRILKMMNRKYTLSDYMNKLDMARKHCPDIALSSDFIVGFPGETEKDFEETLKLIDEAEYDTIFAFAYSPRPMTAALKLDDNVDAKVKARRLNLLLDLQKKKMKEVRNRYLNRVVKILIEKKSPKGETYMGRNEHNIISHVINSTKDEIGTVLDVKILEILENTLRGQKI
ncbi:MAG: tRNA (N6-isopentenyl adenosine(37)-C2)-methylthiotransferase MiaB [bacterium]